MERTRNREPNMPRTGLTKRRLTALALLLLLFVAAFFAAFSFRWWREGEEPPPCRTVSIYLVAETEGSYYLEETAREVPEETTPEVAAVEELIKGPEPGSGLKPAIPASVELLGIEVQGETCTLNLSRELIEDIDDLDPCAARERLALAAIANTLTDLEGIKEVLLEIEGIREGTIDGARVEDFWGYYGLPPVLSRQEDLVGPPGIMKEEELSAWKKIDRQALADSLGWGEVVRGSQNGMRIALTFDAGASGQPTPAILDALKAAGVHSTFFLTGQFVDAYPDLVKRMADEGHEIANHSDTHPEFPKIGLDEARNQMAVTEEKIRSLTGMTTKPYFRFPYGARTQSLVQFVNGEGYLSIFWTVDTLDWMTEATPESIRSRVMNNACPGAIVLMHCGSPQEAQVLPTIIQDLRASGYEVVTLSEVLSP